MTTLASVQNQRRRRTQAERSAATRQALIDSTIDCLAELGYDRATTTEISERALLSRGAHVHHFQTRAALLAAAAQELADRAAADLVDGVSKLPEGRGRAGAALDMVWTEFNGPLYTAILELAVHARVDPELRESLEPLQRPMGQGTREWMRLAFTGSRTDRTYDAPIALAITTIRGLATMRLLEPGRDLTSSWKRSKKQLLTLMEAV